MKIRTKLATLLLLIGLVPTVLVSVIAYVTINRELRDTTSVQLQSAAAKQEQTITSNIQLYEEEMSQIVNQYNLQSTLSEYTKQPSDTLRKSLDEIILDRKVRSPDMQAVYVSDLKGVAIASTLDGTEGKSIADKIDINSRDQYNIRIHRDERDSLSRLYLTSVVSVNNERAGLVTLVYRIDQILAALQDYSGLGDTGETIIASRNGNGNVVSLFPLRFNDEKVGTIRLDSMKLFDNVGRTATNIVDYRGERTIVATRPISTTDWVLATKIDSAEAFSPVDSLRNTLIIILFVTSLLIITISIIIARYFSEPIMKVARVARRIGEGDLDTRVNVRRRDEMGLLSESINIMGENLRNTVTHIEEQRARLEIILNSTTEGILAIDDADVIQLVNRSASELTNQTIDSLVGRKMNEVFTWKQNDEPITVYYDTPDIRSYTNLQYVSPDGTEHFLKLIIVKIQNTDPHAKAQAIVTIHDETKSRELENMKVDFVSMAAHELRTPLAALRGYLELVDFKEGSHISPESQRHIKHALKSTAELGGLINNLLDVTRIERGALVVTPEKIDLVDVVRRAINNLSFAAQDKQIVLSYIGMAEPCYVYADAIAIGEVINNLLTNAVKYTDRGGQVEVELVVSDTSCSVSVRDTGIGIPKQALPHLFTKFYRVRGGLDSGSNGTGLGLYITKSILERHRGTIKVSSEEGVGSTFTFTLPRYETTPSANADGNEQSVRRHRGWITKNITR